MNLLLRSGLERERDLLEGTDAEDKDRERAGRIRCPLCLWQPRPSSRWFCASSPHPEGFLGGCGTAWNTFETRGLCPGCGHRWRWTSCLRCGGWSPHDAWYVDE
ncbi:MAG TPA: hypothetical protein VIL35_04280 [Vicinamibacterales bacterium]